MTQDELAKTMGKSQSSVANKLRLLTLPDEVQDSLLKEQISERHARALLNLTDAQKQKDLLKKIMANKMSVRAVEEEIKRINSREMEGNGNMSELRQVIPSSTGLLNSTPLVPTATMPVEEEEEEIGTVRIVPPTEGFGTTPETSKFINYADIDKEEPEELEQTMDFHDISEPIDINTLRNNASDIKPAGGAVTSTENNLDDLLNIKNPTIGPAGGGNYLTNAEKYIKTEGFVPPTEKVADYFQQPDFSTIDLPTVPEPAEYTVDLAMTKIKDLVANLQEHGVNVRFDEMNFEKSYQVIIKIDKNN